MNATNDSPIKTIVSPVVAGLRKLSLNALSAVKAESSISAMEPSTMLAIFLRFVLVAIATTLHPCD
jgi:hypothetical protein